MWFGEKANWWPEVEGIGFQNTIPDTAGQLFDCSKITYETSKFVELIFPAEQVLLIDGRWRNLGKGVCELYIASFLSYVLYV